MQLHQENLFPENDPTMTGRVASQLGWEFHSPGATPSSAAGSQETCGLLLLLMPWCPPVLSCSQSHGEDENLEGYVDKPSALCLRVSSWKPKDCHLDHGLFYLSVCLSIFLSACPSTCLSIYLTGPNFIQTM